MSYIIPIPSVSSQLATGVHIQKIFGNDPQSIILIVEWLPHTPDPIHTHKVTFVINDAIQIKRTRPLLFNRDLVGCNTGFTIDWNISKLLGVVKKNVQSTYQQGVIHLPPKQVSYLILCIC